MDYEKRINDLEKRIELLEEKRKKHNKTDVANLLLLQEYKDDFIKSDPIHRRDNFNDAELVLWFSYIKYTYKLDSERITSIEELFKRTKAVRNIIQHYIAGYCQVNNVIYDSLETEQKNIIDTFARQRCKNYLEYLPRNIKMPDNKQYNIYIVGSQWALNTYALSASKYAQLKDYGDTPL